MASVVTCQVVYADPDGSVHMLLPIYIDPQGAVHLTTTLDMVGDADEEGAILSRICLSSASSAEEVRRASLRGALEEALQLLQQSLAPASVEEDDVGKGEGSQHHARHRVMERLRSLQDAGAEARRALRRRMLEERSRSLTAITEDLAPPRHQPFFLTYVEERLLLPWH